MTLNDGVEYLLRFGNATADIGSTDDEKSKKADSVSLNRNLFVTAKLNESHYPMPELKPLPETIEQLKEMEAAAKEPKFKPADPASAEPAEKPATDNPEPASEEKPVEPTEAKSDASEKADAPSNAEDAKPAEEGDKGSPAEPASDSPAAPASNDSSFKVPRLVPN